MVSTLIQPRPVRAKGAALSTDHPQVGICVETATSSGQEMVKGVLSYIRAHTTWRVNIPERRNEGPVLPRRIGDGLIAQIDRVEQAAAIAACNVPTVNLGGEFDVPDLPLVAANDESIAFLAVEHLTNLGFKRLGVCGRIDYRSSLALHDAFILEARARDADVQAIEVDPADDWEASRDKIAAWLKDSPQPLGLLACDDALGQQILDACLIAGIDVPKGVAVLGVGNDELICRVAEPQLSSIVLDNGRMGYEAAQHLHRLLDDNGPSPPRQISVEPVQLAARRSSDALVVDDPDVAAAARYIREHALEGIKVADVLNAVPMSRRVLETRFRSHFGRTLHQEILSIQLDRIKALLRDAELSMVQIATAVGFRHVEYMSVVFKREVGITPSDYRRQCQERR